MCGIDLASKKCLENKLLKLTPCSSGSAYVLISLVHLTNMGSRSKSPDRERHRRRDERDRGGDRDIKREKSRSRERDRSKDKRDRRGHRERNGPKDTRPESEKYGLKMMGKMKEEAKGDVKEEPQEKEGINLGLSGALTADVNTFNGVVIKYAEPPEARLPKRRWRFYVFKGEEVLPTLHLHRQSAYLIGRDRKVN